MEDANFEEKSANSAIMRMYTLKEWIEETLKDDKLRTTEGDVLWDKLFNDELNLLVHEAYQHYESKSPFNPPNRKPTNHPLRSTNYKLALKSSLYDFTSARDFYREACFASGTPMSRPLLLTYVRLQALVISTIAPHWAEYMWLEVLHSPSTIQFASWPSVPDPSPALTAARQYVKTTSSNITSAEAQASKKITKGKTAAFDPKKPKRLTIFAATSFPAWQDKYVDLVRGMLESSTLSDDKTLNASVAKMGKGPEMKKAMPFVQALKKRLVSGEKEKSVFERKLPFDEAEILAQMKSGLVRTTGAQEVVVQEVDENSKGLPATAENAVPGSPTFLFENIL